MKVGDIPEGDSLIYLITIGGKFRIFLMSTANFIERAIAGLKPDVALVASIFANQIHEFTPRLLRALNYPKVILPTHWDNFEKALCRRSQGSARRVRRSGEPRPVGEGGQATVTQEQGRGDEVL
jgi:L-ascorbate metabolism protein UlaG (beta-lactamase superfamily)